MKTQFKSFPKRLFFALLISLSLLCSVSLTVYAVPNENTAISEPEEEEISQKWVDLKAHVPEDFTGSVSVLLQHDETGELYTVTSYLINDFVNSVYLPVGKYTVMQAYTSEDSFLYDVFIETEVFDLQKSLELEVTVQKNTTGAAYLEQLKNQPPVQAEPLIEPEEPVVPSEPEASVDTEQEQKPPVEGTIPEGKKSEQEDPSASTEQSEQSEQDESQESWIVNLMKTILGILFSFVILGIIFLGALLLIRKLHD